MSASDSGHGVRVAKPSEAARPLGNSWPAARDYAGIVLLSAGLWLVLVHVNAFYSSVLASIMIWTIATSGLNLIAGYGGYPSLVQGAFYGIGGYASTLALMHHHTLWAATVFAVVLSGLAGLVIGVVFSRTRGQYFAIGTLFFGAVVGLVMNNWASVTNGPTGLSVPFAFSGMASLNVVLVVCMAAMLILVRFLSRRRLGRRLLAIRADEDLAEHLGVPTAWTKLVGFVISACVGGLAGVMIAQYNGTLSPALFDYYVGFVMFVAVSVGGAGRVLGPLLGSAFIVGVPDLLNLPSGIGQLLVGVVFVLVVLVMPGGFMSAIDRFVRVAARHRGTG